MSDAPDPGGPDEPAGPQASPLGLDPDLAAETARRGGAGVRVPGPARAVDPRRYRWMVGVFGLVVVVVISVVSFLGRGVVTTGVPAHQRLRYFAAPLARSNLGGVANVADPTCTLARHDPAALNVCLLAQRGPLVLAFFVVGGTACKQAVDAMQSVSRAFPSVQFAAVAIGATHAAAERVVRAHRWTIPVAYDADGAVGYQYGIEACPLIELAYRGGIVQDRLIGEHWARPAALAERVRELVASQPR